MAKGKKSSKLEALDGARADGNGDKGTGQAEERPKSPATMRADERFDKAYTDPRFKRLPQVHEELDESDERFQQLRTDPRFARYGEFQLQQPQQASGKEASSHQRSSSFLPGIRGSVSPPETSSDDESEGDVEEVELQEVGEGRSTEPHRDESAIAHYIVRENEGDASVQRIAEGEETCRLAVLDLDWDNIRAVDVFAFLRSFCGHHGRLLSVQVKPTQLGMDRLHTEVTQGPRAIFGNETGEPVQNDADEADEDAEEIGDEDALERIRQYEREKLRYYFAIAEFDSTQTANRVYCECDGTEFERSGNVVDLRFIRDDHSFEDRPIKDSATSIPSGYQPPRFETKALQHSQAVLTWDRNDSHRKNALQRRLDDDALKRWKRIIYSRRGSSPWVPLGVQSEDMKAYLASESEEEEEEDTSGERAIAERYKSLLLGSARAKDDGDEQVEPVATEAKRQVYGTKSKDEGELHVKFNTGLEETGGRRARGMNHEAAKSVFEQKQEHVSNRLHKNDHSQKDDLGFDDPFFQEASTGNTNDGSESDEGEEAHDDCIPTLSQDKSTALRDAQEKSCRHRKHKSELVKARKAIKERQDPKIHEAGEQTRADAEMLTMDDTALRDGWVPQDNSAVEGGEPVSGKMRKESKKQRIRRLRLEKERRKQERRGGNVDGVIDTSDERFQKLFESPDFALDPTDPQYRDAGSVSVIEQERRKRRAQKRQTSLQAEGADIADKLPPQKRRKPHSRV